MKKLLINLSLSVLSIILTLLLVEAVAQIYVHNIEMKGKLFEPDIVAGWKVKPYMEIQRKNSDGNIWTIGTGRNGFRGEGDWDSEMRRVLILGDSFAFGEGVDLEYRFDKEIVKIGYSVLNTGVMGYGTDQQFLKAKPYLAELAHGDILVVLTYYNDFYDINRKYHSGRAKPWYDIDNGILQLHKPQITINEVLRDKSYFFAKLGSLLAGQHEASDSDIVRASKIYQAIIENETEPLIRKGVIVILAYHGVPIITNLVLKNEIVQVLNYICKNGNIHCLDVDRYFDVNSDKNYFLSDGHWNNRGHQIVGELLAKKISSIPR